jgi:hypothetical protein
MTIHIKIKHWSALVLLVVGTFLNGCKDPEYPTPKPSVTPPLSSRILAVHASPDVPALNILVNNVPIISNVGYLQTSNGYVNATAGPALLRGKAASGTIGGTLGTNDLLFRAGATNQNNFNFAGNTNYTVFITDTLTTPRPNTAGGTNPGGPQFLIVQDNLTVPAAGKAHVRFINLAANAQTVEVINGSTNQSLLPTTAIVRNNRTTNTAPINNYQRRAYREVSKSVTIDNDRINSDITLFTPVDVGAYTLQVVNSGSAATGTRALTTPITFTQNLLEGKIYTIYLHGLVGKNNIQATGVKVVQHN